MPAISDENEEINSDDEDAKTETIKKRLDSLPHNRDRVRRNTTLVSGMREIAEENDFSLDLERHSNEN